jgi:threonine dehydratase
VKALPTMPHEPPIRFLPMDADWIAGLAGFTVAAAVVAQRLLAARRRAPLSELHKVLFERTLAAATRGTVQTRLMESPLLAVEPCAQSVWLKLESEQVTGSFKARGATAAVFAHREQAHDKGVITASTGNHGKGVLHACKTAGIPMDRVSVFVPKNISDSKLAALRTSGATIAVQETNNCEVTETLARAAASHSGALFVSPYNDLDVISGQARVGMEMVQQWPCSSSIDVVLVSVGGGGLISGVASSVKRMIGPGVRVYGCQPSSNPCMSQSIAAGRILPEGEFTDDETLSDGTAGGIEAGSVTFELCRTLVDDWLLVEEDEIRQALRWTHKHHGLLLEGAAGCAIACVRASRFRSLFEGKNVVVVVCGGNASSAVKSALTDS